MKFRTIATATAALLALGPTGLASAAPPTSGPTILAEGLISPLHLSVSGKDVAVSESFAGQIRAVSHRGFSAVAYSNPGWDVGGTDIQGKTMYLVESVGAGAGDPSAMVGTLRSIDQKGTIRTITDDIAAHEVATNPDAGVQYGLSPADVAANPECVAEMGAIGLPASYTGADVVPDSHVYGLAISGKTAYIADAGANAVFSVDLKSGKVKTVAVLPARPALITEAAANTFGLPSCIGLEYSFESVPTDIEVGPDGQLYVGSLPGGPEDASLGARGAVFTVSPKSGKTRLYVDGLLSPTGIALDGSGNLYVASLFGPGVLKVAKKTKAVSVVAAVEGAAAVEVSGNMLYYTYNALAEGVLASQRL